MADTQTAETTQQVTSQIPIASPRQKNPKRVAAGKLIAEKRRQAREEQNKKLAEADAVIKKERLRKVEEEARKAEEAVAGPPVEDPVVAPATTPPAETQTLTTTQWLSIASIIVSLAAIYYKREELKRAIAKIKAPVKEPVKEPDKEPAKEPVLLKKKGIRSMD